jgi:3-(3-hydroxy-phenyl)propionate hydroxylase
MASALECDVLIVGAGPTGATLALLLARSGVRALAIDKEADIYPLPRAAHIDHEIVRVFQELGLADAIMATCRQPARYDFLSATGEILLRFEGMDRLASGGWPAGNMIHQPLIEGMLRRALAREGLATLKTRWLFRAFAERGDQIHSAIDTPDGPVTVTSRYIVGADGARSPLREAATIGLDDYQFDEPWLVIDTIVHDASRLPQANLQICDPERPTTCVLMGAGRHRWEFMIKPGETPDRVMDDAFIAGLLEPWDVEGAVTLERKAVYRFNANVAKTWHESGVLLAGDAAHQMPPFAGQGLCSGIRDAANLAWKLAAIITRDAPDRLLDTYQIEREPNVRAIIDVAMMMGRMVCITDPRAAARRDAQMLAARAAGGKQDAALRYPALTAGCVFKNARGAGSYFPQSVACDPTQRLDDILGPGAWLIARSAPASEHHDGVGLSDASLDDAFLSRHRDQLSAWLSAHDAEAVLVRPDRYVFGSGDTQTLRNAWRDATR